MTSQLGSKGTVILTGANGTLGLATAQSILESYPSHLVILTVRNDSESDANTNVLRNIVGKFPSSKVFIEALDLASLSSVRSFSQSVADRVSTGKLPPISAVICNAFTWSLLDTRFSKDNYECTFQVSHLSHFVLVLKLLDSMETAAGRVVLLASDQHDDKRKISINKLGAHLPDRLEELIHPIKDKMGEEAIRGFQRYANSKLTNVMFVHTLNRKLLQEPKLQKITALAMDPGGMPASRCFNNTPFVLKSMMRIAGPLVPLLAPFTNSIRTVREISWDLSILSLGPEMSGVRGYFEGKKTANSSIASQDEVVQEDVWQACVRWAGLQQSETILNLG